QLKKMNTKKKKKDEKLHELQNKLEESRKNAQGKNKELQKAQALIQKLKTKNDQIRSQLAEIEAKSLQKSVAPTSIETITTVTATVVTNGLFFLYINRNTKETIICYFKIEKKQIKIKIK